jgi:hypothetical protein
VLGVFGWWVRHCFRKSSRLLSNSGHHLVMGSGTPYCLVGTTTGRLLDRRHYGEILFARLLVALVVELPLSQIVLYLPIRESSAGHCIVEDSRITSELTCYSLIINGLLLCFWDCFFNVLGF